MYPVNFYPSVFPYWPVGYWSVAPEAATAIVTLTATRDFGLTYTRGN